MVNVIYRMSQQEILPKQLETFDKYCKVLQWGRQHPTRFAESFIGVQFTDSQKYVILSSWIPSNIVICASRSSGKATSLDTKVMTHGGNGYKKTNIFKTVGELKVGDKIFDADGELTEVIHLNPIIFEEPYEVEFEDGEVITCNGEHLWYVWDRNFDKNQKYNDKWVLRNTDYIYNHFKRESAKAREQGHNDYTFHVPVNKPINFSKAAFLPIPPYVLGVWLGDGYSASPTISSSGKDVDEMCENLKNCGVEYVKKEREKNKNDCYKIFINRKKEIQESGDILPLNVDKISYNSKLRNLNLINNKHIPDSYKYGSIQDRLELLQGLMDTDGTIDKTGHCEFTQTNKVLFDDFCWLASSLGIKVTPTFKEHTHYIKKNGEEAHTYRAHFTTSKEMPIFKLKRKYDRLSDMPLRNAKQKAIVDVRKLDKKIPMRCITVSNKNGLFLCGEHNTVTHNSFMSAPLIMLRSLLIPSHNTYIMGPTGSQAQETFVKMENLAKSNIASVLGVSSVFLDETVRMNSKADPFVHDKNSYHTKLYNGSAIYTLNSVAKNIVGNENCRFKFYLALL